MAVNRKLMVRGERFGCTVLRLAAAATLVLLVLGATLEAARAEPTPGGPGMSKDDFATYCRTVGGRVVDLGDIMRCDYPPDRGGAVICSWSLNQCWNIKSTFSKDMLWEFDGQLPELPADLPPFYPDPDVDPSGTHGDVGGGVAVDSGGTTGGTRPIQVRSTATSGTIVVLDEDDDRR